MPEAAAQGPRLFALLGMALFHVSETATRDP